jgi:type I restriction enzyme S subunit
MREDSSKESPYGPIPQDWGFQPLAVILDVVMDYRGRTPIKLGMEWGGGEIPALSAKNVCMGMVDLSRETYFGSEALYARWMTSGDPARGDVLITLEAPLGNIAWIPDERKYILSQRVVLLRPKPSMVDKVYLGYQLMSEHFQSALVRNSTGTTATGIQRAKLETIPVLIPGSFDEQRRIGVAIDTINEAIAKTEAVITKLKQVRSGLLHDLLTQGLDKNGQLRDPIVYPEQFQDSPLGWIPKEWEVIPLGKAIAVTFDYRGRTPLKLGMEWGGGEICALSANNVEMGRINFEKETYLGSVSLYERWMTQGDVEKGDVLITMEAPLGNIAQILDEKRYILSQRIVLLRPKPDLLSKDFLALQMMGARFQRELVRHSTGTTAVGIQRAKLETIPIAVPGSVDEQNAIAENMHSQDRSIDATFLELEKLQQIKSGLMTDLLTGRIRVPEEIAVVS